MEEDSEMQTQWARYRREIHYIMRGRPDVLDYFSEKTQEEVVNRDMFEGMFDDE